MMLLSVVMPVYNAEERLEIAVSSVMAQTYQNLELILVDDGSKDTSGRICDRIAEKDPRVTVIYQENAGVSVARNRGIAESHGEYITFVDADDTVDSVAYAQAMESLTNDPVDMYVCGMSFDFYRKGRLVRKKEMSLKKELRIKALEIGPHFFELYDCNYFSSVGNKLFRAAVIKENHLQFCSDMAILEDFKFSLDVVQQCNVIVATPYVFYRYYNNLEESSFSRRPPIDYMNNFRILDDKLRAFAKFANLNDEKSIGRINAMVLRYYLIAMEKTYSSNASIEVKQAFIKSFLYNEGVTSAAQQAVCAGIRMKLVCKLIRRQQQYLLHLIFLLNSILNTRKIRTS